MTLIKIRVKYCHEVLSSRKAAGKVNLDRDFHDVYILSASDQFPTSE